MRILVTGVSGLVGSNLHNLLGSENKIEIKGISRSVLGEEGIYFADLCEMRSLRAIFETEHFDCVVHCAAEVKDHMSIDSYQNNLVSTLNLVTCANFYKCSCFIHISSVPIIGEICSLPITENHIVKPTNLYHMSKYHSEQIVSQLLDQKMQYLNIRIPSPIGIGMPKSSVVSIFRNRVRTATPIVVNGKRGVRQNFLDLRDLTGLIKTAIDREEISGLFNIAAKKSHSYFELATSIRNRFKSTIPIIEDYDDLLSAGENLDWSISTQKAKDLLGYEAQYDLSESLLWMM